MCDNATSDVVEQDCDLCQTRITCYQARCKWYPDVYLESTYRKCFDSSSDVDGTLIGALLLMVSFCFVIWALGWCIKDSGLLAAVRRYGVTVNAEVLEKGWDHDIITTIEGYQIPTQVYWVVVEFERPLLKRRCRWLSLPPERWPEEAEGIPPPPPPPPPDELEGGEGGLGAEPWRLAAGKLWDEDADEDWPLFTDPVQMEVKCNRREWEGVEEGSIMRISYDPKDPTSVLPAGVALASQTMNKFLLCVAGVTVCVALAGGGVRIMQYAHNCGERPACCLQAGLACDGLGGKTHAEVCGPQCINSRWMMWAMLGGMSGLFMSVILVMLQQMGTLSSDTLLGKVIDALCDYGEFCAPDTENNARRADIQRRKAVEARLASVQPILDQGRIREADSQSGPRGGVDARFDGGRL